MESSWTLRLGSGSPACINPVLEEIPLHRIACELELNDKVLASLLKMAAANLKFAERCVIEGIVGEAL